MDGDRAPLREIVELKDRFGAWLMADEAHATGIHGKLRRGLAEEMGVSDRIEIQMGTLGKAMGERGFSRSPTPAVRRASLGSGMRSG